ncbi:MAG: hypothetical protein KJ063_16860 [Anaerolineae bacterium]|nr:hypothetical protein [Anaerolineae bacterium]
MDRLSRFVLFSLLLLLALALRVYALDDSSMWSDEGLSLYRAQQPIPVILANTITIDGVDTTDTNPQLYFLLLHSWRNLVGESVYALRYLGVLLGVLNVALMVPTTRLLFRVSREQSAVSSQQSAVPNLLIPLTAAALLTLSPFHIWYSQELRNYTLLLLCNLLATYALGQLIKQITPHAARFTFHISLWIMASLAGVATHYFSFFVLVVQGGVLGAWLLGHIRKLPRWVWGAAATFTLLLIPIMQLGVSRWQTERQVDFVYVPLSHVLSHVISAFSAGVRPTFVAPLWSVAPLLLLVLLGSYALWSTGRSRFTLFWLLTWLFAPILILNLLSLFNPVYNGPRHLMMSLPPFLLLAAGSIFTPHVSRFAFHASRFLIPGLFMAVILIQGGQIRQQFNDGAYRRDEIRDAAAYLTQAATADDLIVLHDAIIQSLFAYYYEGAAAVVVIPPLYEQDVARAISQLQAAAASAQRVWFLTDPTPRTGFPRTALTNWANEQWPTQFSRLFPSIHLPVNLVLYVPDPTVNQIPVAAAATTAITPELHLQGVLLPDTAQAGGYWQPTFYWSAAAAAGPYTLSFRFQDSQGEQWGQMDIPLWEQFPPAKWPPGATIRYQPPLLLPAGMPPGPYQVTLRLLGQPDGQPIPREDGAVDWLLLDELWVGAAAYPAPLPPSVTPIRPLPFNGGPALRGYTLADVAYRPGHIVPVTLYWQTRATPTDGLQLRLQLRDGDGQIVSETVGSPSRADYPSGQWPPGQLLMGQATLLVPALVDNPPYTVQMSLLTAEGRPLRAGLRQTLSLGEITVVPWPFVSSFPPWETRLRADFGEPVWAELHGYTLSAHEARPGDVLTLELVWRAAATLPANYTVFVHLVDEDEKFIGQGDSGPVGGVRPTTGWRPGEVLVDQHTFRVADAAAPGTYRLFIGLYHPADFHRLPIWRDGIPQSDQRLWLTNVSISP